MDTAVAVEVKVEVCFSNLNLKFGPPKMLTNEHKVKKSENKNDYCP